MINKSEMNKFKTPSIKISQPTIAEVEIQRFEIPSPLNTATEMFISKVEESSLGVIKIADTTRLIIEDYKINTDLLPKVDLSFPEVVNFRDNLDIFHNQDTLVQSIVGQQDYSLNSFRSNDFIGVATSAFSQATSLTESLIEKNNRYLTSLNTEAKVLEASLIVPEVNRVIDDPALYVQPGPAGESIGRLAGNIQNNLGIYNNLLDTSLASSRITSEIFNMVDMGSTKVVSDTIADSASLIDLGTSVYLEYAKLPTIDQSSYLYSAPSIEPYSNVRVNSVWFGASDRILDKTSIERTESILEVLGDELENRLKQVDPRIAEIYNEAISAINSGHRGWIRHAGVSFRECLKHLFRILAPDDQLNSFFNDPENQKENGNFTRASQLKYIFHGISIGSYAKMAEKDIELAQAAFFPLNQIVHSLGSSLTKKQMKVFSRRIQGSVSVVLEAAGY